jgi:hypothetical protein
VVGSWRASQTESLRSGTPGTKRVNVLLVKAWAFMIDFRFMNGPDFAVLEHPAQAIGWLELLGSLMPDTVRFNFEVSGYLVFVFASLVALWIWRRYSPRGGRRRNE